MIDLRVGYGVDVHRLVPGRRLVLGGVDIPFDRGLEGHSDADVLAHAIGDALLGALALGDLGQHFPDTDPRYKDCSSLGLLQRIASMVAERKARTQNIDCTIIAEVPKLAPHLEEMKRNLAQVLGVEPERISIKATTTEGLGFSGQGEGIEARAVALLRIGGEWRPLEH